MATTSTTRNVFAGTYQAEQRDCMIGTSYYLQAMSPVRKPHFAGNVSPRKKGAARFDHHRCLKLPEHTDDVTSMKEADKVEVSLPSIPCARPYADSRHWQTGRKPTRVGEVVAPVPTDLEFKTWITPPLPLLKLDKKAGKDRGSGDREGAGKASKASNKLATLSMEVSQNPEPAMYYEVVLIGTTLEGSTARAASTVARVLGISQETAEQHVVEATEQRFAVLKQYEDQAQAFDAALALRAARLRVQVVSQAGLPSGGDKRRRRKRQKQGGADDRSSSYAKVFHDGMKPSILTERHKVVSLNLLPHVERQARTESKDASGNVAVAASNEVKSEEEEQAAVAGEEAEQAVAVQTLVIANFRKEICQLLRLVLWGTVGNEHLKTKKEKDSIFYEPLGTREQVKTVMGFWKKLDDDNSGRTDLPEFRRDVEELLREMVNADTLPEWVYVMFKIEGRDVKDRMKVVLKYLDKLAHGIMGKKSSFVFADLLRVCWPAAQQAEILAMTRWTREFEKIANAARVKTPPVLEKEHFEGLRSVFEWFDEDNSGELTFDEVVQCGLIYEDQIEEYKLEWDANGDGSLDVYEFCDMMCPRGYRAYPNSKVGSQKDGTRLVLNEGSQTWEVKKYEVQAPAESGGTSPSGGAGPQPFPERPSENCAGQTGKSTRDLDTSGELLA